ncbi:hypothetical protein CROQUDRAFT_104019 [Cronartium quercuum f. sp. fusiforme G11]|uniref:Uncharacterized protein n=1 Tax=Cronartium quercuum f. sp. fusiforme G11 TaxID=708437 RepID=A0A9P6NV38_9BASI|nr:hypothetical protein CROQUDRAFT_104019 [Cronartium quercuum f. sp. fusiforme G11]
MNQHQATVRFREQEVESEENRATRPTATNNSFAFKVLDALEVRRENIQRQLDCVNQHLASLGAPKKKTNPGQTGPGTPTTTADIQTRSPTSNSMLPCDLVASKHAPSEHRRKPTLTKKKTHKQVEMLNHNKS